MNNLPPPRQLPGFAQYDFLEQLRIAHGLQPKKQVKMPFGKWIKIMKLKTN